MKYCCFYRLKQLGVALFIGGILATCSFGAEPATQAHEEGVPLAPDVILHIGKFAVTNSMLVTWIVAAAIIIFAQTATRNIQPVPGTRQNRWEWLVESLYNFLESVIGPDLVKRTFWFFATIFIFILCVNWF